MREAARKRAEQPAMRPWMLVVLGVLVVLFGFGGAWAWLARIEGAVIARGIVSPESGIKTIQHPDGGIVKEILVREGQRVERGQILLVLRDDVHRARLSIITSRLDTLLAEKARLEAERDGRSTMEFPPELLERLARNDRNVARIMNNQRALFEARRRTLKGQKSILREKMAALERSILGLKAEIAGNRRQAALVRDEIRTVEGLLKKGQATKPRLLSLRRELARLEGRYGRLLGEVAKAERNVAEISLQLIQLDKDMRSSVLDELSRKMEKIDILKEEKIILLQKLERGRIRSPVSGRVLNLEIRTIGGVIQAGKPIMQIVPEREQLVIETRIAPQDIDQVRAGQKSRVVLSAFSQRTTPVLEGMVRMVSPAPRMDELQRRPFYLAEIVIPASELTRLGADRQLVPGMPAEVFISTEARSPLQILLQPLTGSMRRVLRGS